MAGIIKIVKRIEVDGFKKKSKGSSQQSSLSRNEFLGKNHREFKSIIQYKEQGECASSKKGGYQGGKLLKKESCSRWETKEVKTKTNGVMNVAKINDFIMDCPNKKVSTNASYVYAID